MNEREIRIEMSAETVDTLRRLGYRLCGFKAVRSRVAGGSPRLWFQSDYDTTTHVRWQSRHQAYVTALARLRPRAQVPPGSVRDVAPGDTMEVQDGGTTTVFREGQEDAVGILNASMQPLLCGLSQWQSIDGIPTPYCVFPLLPHTVASIAPLDQVLLMFSTMPQLAGAVMQHGFSNAVLVDLTSASSAVVRFDMNEGWEWSSGTRAQRVTPSAKLVPLLIQGAEG
jgi:hypothetical protein